jgi:8-oxo-dGTP pyrophosphatase MutT (NUDIX family)
MVSGEGFERQLDGTAAVRGDLSLLDMVLAHREVERLARALRARPGVRIQTQGPERRAAVALILRPGDGGVLELLMIKRALHERDPWSGHVALPGGRQEPGDATLEHTAIRETREEIDVDLSRHARVLGTLDDVHPRTAVLPPIVITPVVAALAGNPTIVRSPEVAEAFWVPVDALRDPAATRDVVLELTTGPRTVRSFQHRDYTIWGLTERILRQLLEYLG